MSNITTTNVWPATLPLPAIDYTGGANPPTLVSGRRAAHFKRRRRWVQTYSTLTVRWKLTREEYTEFKAYWQDTLGHGSANVEIELKYPKQSALDEWVVKFLSDLSVTTEDNSVINVSATIQLLNLKALADKAAALETLLFVQGAGSSAAAPEQFLVQKDSTGATEGFALVG